MEGNMTTGWENSSLISDKEDLITGFYNGTMGSIGLTNITSNATGNNYGQGQAGFDLMSFNRIAAPTLTAFGTVGNILSFWVLCQPRFADVGFAVYLRALAVMDTLFLWISQNMVIVFEVALNSPLRRTEVWACKTWMWLNITIPWISSWLLVALTIERTIAVRLPYKVKLWCTKRNAIYAVMIICLFFMIGNIHILVTFSTKNVPGGCFPQDIVYLKALESSAVFIYSIIPAIVIIICNTVIITATVKASRARKSMTASQASTAKSEISITVMLLVNSFVFIILTLPLNVVVSQNDQSFFQGLRSYQIMYALSLLATSNHAFNFLLYSVSGSLFRTELVNMFRCDRRPKPSFPLRTPRVPIGKAKEVKREEVVQLPE